MPPTCPARDAVKVLGYIGLVAKSVSLGQGRLRCRPPQPVAEQVSRCRLNIMVSISVMISLISTRTRNPTSDRRLEAYPAIAIAHNIGLSVVHQERGEIDNSVKQFEMLWVKGELRTAHAGVI